MEHTSFDALELLIEAHYSREKISILQRANVKLEQLCYYVRLCHDLKLINGHRYEVMSKMINGIGMQLGGWIKQQRGRA